MSARSFMTHRCDTERDVESAQSDPSGHPVTELRDINTALPCYWQVRTERLILDGGKAAARYPQKVCKQSGGVPSL